MWRLVNKLRESGVTIILTTHYIEEAEEIADRIGVINGGEILLVENKNDLMQKLGKKQLIVDFKEPVKTLPDELKTQNVTLSDSQLQLTYTYDTESDATGITKLLNSLSDAGHQLSDIKTTQSSLEDIFVDLVKEPSAILNSNQKTTTISNKA